MHITVRNITKDKEFEVYLPQSEEGMEKYFSSSDEYIILDSDGALDPDEFSSIKELNHFLLECQEKEIDEETLRVLSRTYLYNEVLEKVKKDSYIIVNFDAETAGWNNGSGGNFWDDDDKGLLLHELGLCRFDWEKENPITEAMEDDICWENLWINANCSGWNAVRVGDGYYLVYGR